MQHQYRSIDAENLCSAWAATAVLGRSASGSEGLEERMPVQGAARGGGLPRDEERRESRGI